MTQPPKTVSVLLYDGLCMFEFGCVAEVFGLPRPEVGKHWYRFETVSIGGGPVRTQYHGQISANKSIDQIQWPGTLIIPGWSGLDVEPPESLLAVIREANHNGSRLLSICSGVFVLAAAGILNGQSATTHWKYCPQLAEQYPEITVRDDVLYVDNGNVLTSAGSAAGLDLCLHLVRRDFGRDIANSVARRLVIPPFREGNQAQFIERPVPKDSKSSIAKVLESMQSHLADQHPVPALARSINMSERTFLRRFREATGTTPGDWLSEARIQFAKELLESTDLPIDTLAQRCGFGSATTLRHHFKTRLNVAPLAYRKMFNRSGGNEANQR